eukprot:359523-Chlamydomonas_euryale.AAC.5
MQHCIFCATTYILSTAAGMVPQVDRRRSVAHQSVDCLRSIRTKESCALWSMRRPPSRCTLGLPHTTHGSAVPPVIQAMQRRLGTARPHKITGGGFPNLGVAWLMAAVSSDALDVK